MRKLIIGMAGASALAFASTAANASVTIGGTGSSCSPSGCVAGSSTATVTDNVGMPNKIEFDDTNASAGTQTGWFNFYVDPSMLGTFSATAATYPASTVTLLELLDGGDSTTAGSNLLTSTPGTQLTWSNLTAGTWYTFRYTADMATAGNISGNGTFYSAVPEPGTWGLMLLGFGAIGLSMRRRRRPVLAQVA
jgi:hypothetical protein